MKYRWNGKQVKKSTKHVHDISEHVRLLKFYMYTFRPNFILNTDYKPILSITEWLPCSTITWGWARAFNASTQNHTCYLLVDNSIWCSIIQILFWKNKYQNPRPERINWKMIFISKQNFEIVEIFQCKWKEEYLSVINILQWCEWMLLLDKIEVRMDPSDWDDDKMACKCTSDSTEGI